MMTMIRKLIPATLSAAAATLAALALLAACTSGELPGGTDLPASSADPDRVPIRLQPVYLTPDAATPADDDADDAEDAPGTTRAVINPDNSNSWQEGDAVGLFIVKGEGKLMAEGNWVDNAKLTYSGGTWHCALPEDRQYYPRDERLHFYAYTPYEEGYKATVQTASYPADQRGGCPPLVCVARKKGVTKTHDPVPLAFSPLAAILEVRVKNGYWQAPGGRVSELLMVSLLRRSTQFKYQLGTDLYQEVSMRDTVLPYRVEQPGDPDYATTYTFRACLPQQTIMWGDNFVFTHMPLVKNSTTQRRLDYSPNLSKKLELGHVYPFEIGLNPHPGPPDVEYKVGDFYLERGLPLGVVYELIGSSGSSSGGQQEPSSAHGRVVSLFEVNDMQWGTEDTGAPGYVGIETGDQNNGRVNMKTLYDANGAGFDKYPLFGWAAGLNPTPPDYTDGTLKGVWYIPARNEAGDMIGQTDKINEALRKAGYKEMNEAGKDYFMTSTSSELFFTSVQRAEGNMVFDARSKSQTEDTWCRAILEF